MLQQPLGIPNFGNTCYLNSSIQAIVSALKFRKINININIDKNNDQWNEYLNNLIKLISQEEQQQNYSDLARTIIVFMVEKIGEKQGAQSDASKAMLNIISKTQVLLDDSNQDDL